MHEDVLWDRSFYRGGLFQMRASVPMGKNVGREFKTDWEEKHFLWTNLLSLLHSIKKHFITSSPFKARVWACPSPHKRQNFLLLLLEDNVLFAFQKGPGAFLGQAPKVWGVWWCLNASPVRWEEMQEHRDMSCGTEWRHLSSELWLIQSTQSWGILESSCPWDSTQRTGSVGWTRHWTLKILLEMLGQGGEGSGEDTNSLA